MRTWTVTLATTLTLAALCVPRAALGDPLAPAPDDALAETYVLESAEELKAARRVACREAESHDGHDAWVRCGWLRYRLGEQTEALNAYRHALAQRPDSTQAGLGETLVLATLERWEALERAADHLTRQHPAELWGWVRLGLARLQQEQLSGAEAAYGRALEIAPDSAEAHLGLGFVARARDDMEAARRECGIAAQALPEGDARVAACLASPPSLTVLPSLWAAFAGYTSYYTRESVWSVAAETALRWRSGLGAYVGLAYSRTALRFARGDYWQLMPSVGLSFRERKKEMALSYLFAWEHGAGSSSEHVPFGWAAWRFDELLVGLEVATPVSSSRALIQLTPVVSFDFTAAHLTVAARPSLSAWLNDDRELVDDSMAGDLQVSGEIALTWAPAPRLRLDLSGWYGRRRNFVTAGGHWVWNTDDVFQGGWQLRASLRAASALWLIGRFSHDLGVEQGGRAFDFHLFIGQLGVIAAF